ncbi:DUF2934 domain-containing protein [Rhizobium sp. Root708]|uniref:DUF2934 domain-containing protein n=1 Tax=Rhizobium sp. Root708 TaxID=1736592 RepID=UPI003083D0D5
MRRRLLFPEKSTTLTVRPHTNNGTRTMSEHEEKIRQRAYEIWEREGRPQGEDMKHWLKAFEEIAAEGAPPKKARRSQGAAEAKTAKPATTKPRDDKDKKTAKAAIASDKSTKSRRASTSKPIVH